MKTTNLKPDGATTSKPQSLSRFHPRLKKSLESPDQKTPAPQKTVAVAPVPDTPVEISPRQKAVRKGPSDPTPEFVEQKIFISRASATKSSPPEAAPVDEPVPEQALEEGNVIPLTYMHRAIFAAALLLGFLFTFWYGKSLGHDEAMQTSKPADVAIRPKLPPEAADPFDAALSQLRDGKNLEALSALRSLLSKHPYAPSLHYAAALAAMQAGYEVEAAMLADASIRLGFRVSDSLALKAAISALTPGQPSDDQETLLQEAIATDPMNYNPMLELATLQRYRGNNNDARALLETAALRMNPTDSRTVVDTTLAIMRVGSEPAPEGAPTGIPAQDFPAALAELQKGNFDRAAVILRACKQNISPDLFSYLINDPELRKFSHQPELAGLF